MKEDRDPPICDVPGDDRLAALSRQAAEARLRTIRARPVITIAEVEEAAEIQAAQAMEDIGRACGPFSAEAAQAWERLHRIGYHRRRLFKAGLVGARGPGVRRLR